MSFLKSINLLVFLTTFLYSSVAIGLGNNLNINIKYKSKASIRLYYSTTSSNEIRFPETQRYILPKSKNTFNEFVIDTDSTINSIMLIYNSDEKGFIDIESIEFAINGKSACFSPQDIMANFSFNRLFTSQIKPIQDKVMHIDITPRLSYKYQGSLTMNGFGRQKLFNELFNKSTPSRLQVRLSTNTEAFVQVEYNNKDDIIGAQSVRQYIMPSKSNLNIVFSLYENQPIKYLRITVEGRANPNISFDELVYSNKTFERRFKGSNIVNFFTVYGGSSRTEGGKLIINSNEKIIRLELKKKLISRKHELIIIASTLTIFILVFIILFVINKYIIKRNLLKFSFKI